MDVFASRAAWSGFLGSHRFFVGSRPCVAVTFFR